MNPILYALYGNLFPFFMTALGSATVYLFKDKINPKIERAFLGFAAGIMTAAAVWSLLIPSLEMSEEAGDIPWLIVTIGFTLGVLFLLALDKIVPHMHLNDDNPEGMKSTLSKRIMMFLAVTMHNIPEGLAVGLTFAVAAQSGDFSFASATALSIGIGIQNLPEGAAISLPFKNEGLTNHQAFMLGTLSGVVEPLAGIVAGIMISFTTTILPYLLSFAAGAMLYVVVEELIPEAQFDEHDHTGTCAFLIGFVLMMILDVALG